MLLSLKQTIKKKKKKRRKRKNNPGARMGKSGRNCCPTTAAVENMGKLSDEKEFLTIKKKTLLVSQPQNMLFSCFKG